MRKRIAIVSGVRTPFCKGGGVLRDMLADDLGAYAVKEVYSRTPIDPNLIDEVIIGNVLQPVHATNIARVIAVKAGLSQKIPAYTVNRNCASGMEAVTTGADKILLEQAEIILAGGVESMSNFPILFSPRMRDFLQNLSKAKGWQGKLKSLLAFRPSLFKPVIPDISDPLCGLSMGQTAEILTREFQITRLEQDKFAMESHLRASKATKDGRFTEEIIPIPLPPDYKKIQTIDEGPRDNQTLESLLKLKPVFDPLTGTVTAGNSSPITDGAAAVILMSEEKAKELNLKPLGYILDHAAAGVDPSRMGIGPVYATSLLLAKTGFTLDQIDLIEINEAFAGQVLAVVKAFASDEFARKNLNRDKALGTIDLDKLNVNGGAIALGHPLGASGTRLILTLLLELKKRNKRYGLATLCIGGGQGQACLLEVE
ncbi:MAG: thiolase family protein [Parachlamydiales bacterium]|jgi:acetyl-CoA acyltransferase